MEHFYVPSLPWKRGERVALERLSHAARTDVRPLLVLSPPQYVGRKATIKNPAIVPDDVFAGDVRGAWGMGEFYLDASALPDAGVAHPITGLASAARSAGLKLIPATRLGATVAYQNAVAGIVSADHRGVGLRVDLHEFTTARAWAAQWRVPMGQTDLLADFSGNVGTVFSLGNSVDHAFQTLHRGPEWRTVTMMGTSMPDNFSGLGEGIYTIDRIEWKLWNRISKESLPYRLHYGDYATVPVVTPPEGIAWGYPINVKYTVDDEFLICRGVPTTGLKGVDMEVQLLKHAKSIVGYANRHRLPDCWADDRIDSVSRELEPPHGLEAWVQFGVSRHIELVRSALP